MKYYITHNQKQSGPFEEEEIRRLVLSGEFQRKDFCWTEGMAEWKPLDQVVQLPPAVPKQSKPVGTTRSADDVSGKAGQHDQKKNAWPYELKVALTVLGIAVVVLIGIPIVVDNPTNFLVILGPIVLIGKMWELY